MVYALVYTARRLRRYFQGHPILVLTDQPIKQILKHPESSGRLAKWAIELGEYEINFSPRHAVKGQILANFLLETTEIVDYSRNTKISICMWELHTDGASSEEGVGAGLVLTSPEGEEHTYALKFCFYASNNEAEYKALLSGLRIAFKMGIKYLRAYVDSQIVAQQVNGTFEAKDISMKRYLQLVEKISKNFETLEVVQISRNKNKKADVLSKLATFDHLHKKVLDGTLPDDVTEARRIKVSAPLYVLENGVLYRKSFNGPNLRCLAPQQAVVVVKEMHEDLCAQHSGYRTIVARIMRQGYYWQTIYRDTAETIKACDAYMVCQTKIVSDNGKKFADNPFKSWCEELSIKQTFTSVAHPQANDQVEVTNKEILAGIKARLGLSQTKWVDEVPYVMWAHRTTPKRSTAETPFSLVYGTESVIAAKIRVPTQKVLAFDVEKISSVLRENLNLLEKGVSWPLYFKRMLSSEWQNITINGSGMCNSEKRIRC
ncbi:uncharacterized protein [Rutidosis leptorrhynchoides]|uniref:uncharacterized protein n=1 Tax=Rutidosis leptorrhynchoides TaxID=125765 RepID=UPI003A99E1D6